MKNRKNYLHIEFSLHHLHLQIVLNNMSLCYLFG